MLLKQQQEEGSQAGLTNTFKRVNSQSSLGNSQATSQTLPPASPGMTQPQQPPFQSSIMSFNRAPPSNLMGQGGFGRMGPASATDSMSACEQSFHLGEDFAAAAGSGLNGTPSGRKQQFLEL